MEKRMIVLLLILAVSSGLLLFPACDDIDSSDSQDADDSLGDDDDHFPADDDDDEMTPDDDDITPSDDDDITPTDDDDEDAGPIRYLYGGIVADQSERAGSNKGLAFNIAVSSDGVRWAVGVKARRLLLFSFMPGSDVTVKTIAPFAANPDLALGPDNSPRIVYVDLTNNNLIYAEPDGKSWAFTVVAEDAISDLAPHLAFDDNGNPHLIYYYLEQNQEYVRYAKLLNGSWVIDDTGIANKYTDFAVTGAGQPIIVGTAGTDLDVTYLTEQGWQTEIVQGDQTIMNSPAVAMDSDDRLHIVYGINGVGSRYLVSQNGQWLVEEIDGGFKRPSLALDEADQPRMVAAHYGGRLIYAQRDSTAGWITEIIEDTEQAECRAALSIGPDGSANILRSRSDQGEFGILEKNAGEWNYFSLDAGAAGGEFPVLRLSSTGTVHILFTNDTENEAIYAVSDADGLHWTFETLEIGTCSPAMGLALATDDQPRAAVHSKASDTIQYGMKTAIGWQFETMEGDWPSSVSYLTLELDSTDTPHLAYFDNGDETLKYATRTPAGWQVTSIDSDFEWSWGVSLAVDPDGHAHITAELWGETLWCSLRYASNALGEWFDIALDPLGSCAAGESIAIASDAVQILYGDMVSNSFLRHAWYTDHQWNIEQTALWGGMPSLALDDADELHAATIGPESGLYYARHGETGWTQRPLDEIGEFYPFDPSLAVDANGVGHVAYILNQALWYARFSLVDKK